MASSTVLPPLLRSLVDASLDAAAVVDRDLELLHCNSSYLHLAGLRPRALSDCSLHGKCHEHFGLESCAEACVARQALTSGHPCRVDEVCSMRGALRLIVLAIPLFDERGSAYAVVEQYRDVTAESRMQRNYRRLLEQERAQQDVLEAEVTRQTVELARANVSLREALQEVSRLALTDGLTGLLNRRSFDTQLAEQLARVQIRGDQLALVFFDLDHFKRINDLYGHPTGDRLLQEFAQVLLTSARANDVIARIGGEEFAVLLPGADMPAARAVAARVQERAAQGRLLTTTSGGIACCPSDGLTSSDLLRAADRALYAAKSAGRNCILTCDDLPDQGRRRTTAIPVTDEAAALLRTATTRRAD